MMVEDEVKSETLLAVICDSNNRVQLVNSAYKELVKQPECLWLATIVTSSSTHSPSPRFPFSHTHASRQRLLTRSASSPSRRPRKTSPSSCLALIRTH
ncbi:hypothetical protein AXF42_Ash017182 [Apostasia shenzhenica]|uniref:Uncharacterized protein n=1 Tax=Apostasia shenzhenica TaxID=1088818 RepID=A0A2H9ZVC1_9ASPA|nr:hypothetical protein AXF42_Ash017182 [Apostasia shenzhenica]